MENQSPHLSLRVPTPTQQNLSFCDATPKDIKYWLAHLPKANLGETARQLYQGLIELNQLVLPVEARLQLLELFRPEVHFVCAHLERHFLNQAIVLDERPRKIANLCQALQNHLAIGYKLIVVQEAPRNSRDRAQLFAVGIQRAIRSLCGPLIREYLLQPEAERAKARLPLIEGVTLDLLQHLSSAWGDIAERTFQRTQGQGQLTLCIGMSALHYFLAGRRPFNEVLQIQEAPEAPRFKADVQDAWAGAFDAQKVTDWQPGMPLEEIEYRPHQSPRSVQPGHPQAHAQADATEDYPTYALPIVNHSPGGYCLSWPKEVPAQLQAGELVGLQDLPGQAWSIAVVRWIRQVRNGGTQMGIEMIAPAAQPCGLQLLRKTEQSSHYLRALLLPAIAAISRPATVITPRLPFQEGSRVQINLHGEERRAVLNRRQASTGSFSQFEYRSAEPVNTPSDKPVTAPVARPPAGEEDFDSLWKSL